MENWAQTIECDTKCSMALFLNHEIMDFVNWQQFSKKKKQGKHVLK